jgi:hypothetical protein|tara:strand:- start:6160 stop:6636 length:477 start_codon:yes stop_codon:yes gene_type:complete
MKKLLLGFLTLLFVSCVSVKFPETVAIDLKLDKESAKNLTEAINKSNSKIHMMRLHKDGPISMKRDENIVIINDSEDFEWIGDDGKKMKKVMIRGERFGKGPNANRYMDELPKAIIDRIKRASEKGMDIKIDTIISEDGERREIKIEVKIDSTTVGNN